MLPFVLPRWSPAFAQMPVARHLSGRYRVAGRELRSGLKRPALGPDPLDPAAVSGRSTAAPCGRTDVAHWCRWRTACMDSGVGHWFGSRNAPPMV